MLKNSKEDNDVITKIKYDIYVRRVVVLYKTRKLENIDSWKELFYWYFDKYGLPVAYNLSILPDNSVIIPYGNQFFILSQSDFPSDVLSVKEDKKQPASFNSDSEYLKIFPINDKKVIAFYSELYLLGYSILEKINNKWLVTKSKSFRSFESPIAIVTKKGYDNFISYLL